MAVTTGTRLGTYEITGPLGAGGMGEVYRARDTKLGREVAIKILPDLVAADPERTRRFEREALTLASLNHPHIAQIYGVLEQPVALVMELVDGEDLAQRIARGRVPLDEAIAIARQIADALEAAHERGIVHRDLKPANIRVRPDGNVKVLDFGLAKALAPADVAATAANPLDTPTLTASIAGVGLVVGTPAYMAPEQAKGQPVDRRADVWAFGVLLYELITGRRLFDGPDTSETLAAVLTRTPDWSDLPKGTPPALRRLLARSLVKDPRTRLDSMAAARLDLDEALNAPTEDVSHPRTPVVVLAALAVLAAGALLGRAVAPRSAGPSEAATPVMTAIPAAQGLVSAFIYGFALSPDARTLVYAARGSDGTRHLWRRSLSAASSELIRGTDAAEAPFFSPDGRNVAFVADGYLKRVPLEGGVAQTVCPTAGLFMHGSWGRDGDILISADADDTGWDGIHRVSATGGADVLVLGGPLLHAEWLPDGHHFLYVRQVPAPAQLMVGSIDGGTPHSVLSLEDAGTGAFQFSPAGFIAFDHAGALVAQHFDVAAMRTDGAPFVIGSAAGNPRGHFAVSIAGTTIAALNPDESAGSGTPGNPICRLVWIDREGHQTGTVGGPAGYWTLRLSPDGSQITSSSGDDVWTTQVASGFTNRIGYGTDALWYPGGRELLNRDGSGLLVTPAAGDSPPRRLLTFKDRVLVPTSISPDAAFAIAFARPSTGAKSKDLYLISLSDGSPTPWLETAADEQHGAFSPDGRLIAYTSNQTGRDEVYVRPFDRHAPATRLSAAGGVHPLWRHDGRELVFLSPTDEIMSVDISEFATTGQPPPARRLFRVIMNDATRDWFPPYAIAPDGQRFLVEVPDPPEPLTLIQHADALAARHAGR